MDIHILSILDYSINLFCVEHFIFFSIYLLVNQPYFFLSVKILLNSSYRDTRPAALLPFEKGTEAAVPCSYYTLIKKKRKFSSNVRKFRREQLQSHI